MGMGEMYFLLRIDIKVFFFKKIKNKCCGQMHREQILKGKKIIPYRKGSL